MSLGTTKTNDVKIGLEKFYAVTVSQPDFWDNPEKRQAKVAFYLGGPLRDGATILEVTAVPFSAIYGADKVLIVPSHSLDSPPMRYPTNLYSWIRVNDDGAESIIKNEELVEPSSIKEFNSPQHQKY